MPSRRLERASRFHRPLRHQRRSQGHCLLQECREGFSSVICIGSFAACHVPQHAVLQLRLLLACACSRVGLSLSERCESDNKTTRGAMDFRRVDKQWRPAAIVLQICLALLLIGYAVNTVISIARSADDPPVQTSTAKWRKGAGKWAICGMGGTNSLVGAGVGLLRRSPSAPWDTVTERTGFPLPTLQNITAPNPITALGLNGAGPTLICTVVDLTTWQLPEENPRGFFLCAVALRPLYFVWSGKKWQFVKYQVPKAYDWYRLDRYMHGWNFGYSAESWEIYHVVPRWSYAPIRDNRDCCAEMTWFENSTGAASVIELSIEQETFSEIYMQGVFPQLYSLLGTLGGLLSLLFLVYGIVFVKKYPDSSIAQEYEARTFIGERLGRAEEQQEPLPTSADRE